MQLNVSRHWPDVEQQAARIFMTALQRWKSLAIGNYWPVNPASEQIRMKRYLPDGRDSFPPHVDVLDDADARRFVTTFVYLNDPGGGGDRLSGLGHQRVVNSPGRLVVFPPLWLFAQRRHAAARPGEIHLAWLSVVPGSRP